MLKALRGSNGQRNRVATVLDKTMETLLSVLAILKVVKLI